MLIALTNLDEVNIVLSLFARSKGEMKTVTKINSINFDEVIDGLDLDSVVYPKYVTSESIIRFVRAMKNSIGSNVETLYRLVGNKVEALEFIIKDNAPLLNISLEELELKNGLLIACIHRNGQIIIPKGKDVIKMGDTVVIVTTNTGLNDISDILKN